MQDGSWGEKRGEKKKAIEVARNLREMGMTDEVIAECTGLSAEEIEKI